MKPAMRMYLMANKDRDDTERDGRDREMQSKYDMRMGYDMRSEYDSPEMRRRRDSRGRYTSAEGDDRTEMRYDGGERNEMTVPYRPPYFDGGNDMRRGGERTINLIGFARENERRTPSEYTPKHGTVVNYPRMHEAGYMSGGTMERGHGSAHGGFDREAAEEWVAGLENEDNTTGAHWTFDQTRQVMAQKGVTNIDPVDFYAVINMLYSDYCKVFKKYGVGDKLDFYVDLTKAFIEDKDAGPDKVAAYWEYITKK